MNVDKFKRLQLLAAIPFAIGLANLVQSQEVSGRFENETNIGPILFNSDWLESSWNGAKVDISPDYPATSHAKLVVQPRLSVSDRFGVVEYVLTRCAAESIVYPSEQYFYFKFYLNHRLVSGNLRFCNAEQGIVHFGYFDENDQSCIYTGRICNQNAAVRFDQGVVTIRFREVERRFRLDRSWENADALTLLAGEKLVSGILDESGYYFWLIYNPSERRLYYVLNDFRRPEPLARISPDSPFFVGLTSRFMFYRDHDSERLILVGVHARNVSANNFFDGPFDQVPPNLPLSDLLEHVYPYVKLRGGIDKHGNFVNSRHTRVAISPYFKYSSTTEFLRRATSLDASAVAANSPSFLSLVYESKMDFHKTVDEESYKERRNP